MNDITIITPRTLAEAKELSTTLSGSRTIPEALQKSPADVLAIVMAGGELGLAPMQSIRSLVLIKGKPTLSADAMGALCQSNPICEYLMMRSSTPTKAVYETKRRGHPEPTRMEFAMEDAQRAGLNGDNWRKYPAAMLRARCLSAICRAVYPDLILGVYTPEEIEDPPTSDQWLTRAPPLQAPPPKPRMTPPQNQDLEEKLIDSIAAAEEQRTEGPPPSSGTLEQILADIAAAAKSTDLNKLASPIGRLGDEERATARAAYTERAKVLRGVK